MIFFSNEDEKSNIKDRRSHCNVIYNKKGLTSSNSRILDGLPSGFGNVPKENRLRVNIAL